MDGMGVRFSPTPPEIIENIPQLTELAIFNLRISIVKTL